MKKPIGDLASATGHIATSHGVVVPTPRTDAVWKYVLAEIVSEGVRLLRMAAHAEGLERELDQAERTAARARELLSKWSHDSALQTFEHREKFREEARKFLEESK